MSPAQTAVAVAEGAVAVEQQGRTAQAAWAGCPRRLHLFPRQPRPEHRRPLQSKKGMTCAFSMPARPSPWVAIRLISWSLSSHTITDLSMAR